MAEITIGTRGSELALWQANFVKTSLEELGHQVSLKIIKTQGDNIQHLGFDKLEGKGFFTKEIEDALLSGEVDMAVHSLKDMPVAQPDGLVLAGVSYREDPADWLLVHKNAYAADKPLRVKEGAVIGTSSPRRQAQLLQFRPDLVLKDIRGNVPTRAAKVASGECDAVMLAAAGLTRLNLDLSEYEIIKLPPQEFITAPGQGVMAFQVRSDDVEMKRIVRKIHHPEVSSCTNVERLTLKLLGGGCQEPIGIFCERDHLGSYHAYGSFAESKNSTVKRFRISSTTTVGLAEKIAKGLKS